MQRSLLLLALCCAAAWSAAVTSSSVDAAPEVVQADDQEVPAEGEFQEDQIPGTAHVNDSVPSNDVKSTVTASTGKPSITEVKLSTTSSHGNSTEKSALSRASFLAAAAAVSFAILY